MVLSKLHRPLGLEERQMRFIETLKMSCNWNWHLIPFHLIVCVVYRVRPCPLYRVISWLSKHIHSIQVLGERPCEIHSLFIHLLSSASPFFDSLVEACIQTPASLFQVLFLSSFLFLSHCFSALPLWIGGGVRGGSVFVCLWFLR